MENLKFGWCYLDKYDDIEVIPVKSTYQRGYHNLGPLEPLKYIEVGGIWVEIENIKLYDVVEHSMFPRSVVIEKNDSYILLVDLFSGDYYYISFDNAFNGMFEALYNVGRFEIEEHQDHEPEKPKEYKPYDYVTIKSCCDKDLDGASGVVTEVQDDDKFKYLVNVAGIKLWVAADKEFCSCCDEDDRRINNYYVDSEDKLA